MNMPSRLYQKVLPEDSHCHDRNIKRRRWVVTILSDKELANYGKKLKERKGPQ